MREEEEEAETRDKRGEVLALSLPSPQKCLSFSHLCSSISSSKLTVSAGRAPLIPVLGTQFPSLLHSALSNLCLTRLPWLLPHSRNSFGFGAVSYHFQS